MLMLPKRTALWCRVTGLLAYVLASSCGCLAAQTGVQVPEGKPYTLHVYEDQVDVPTLVLTRHYTDMPGLPREDFSIRLDSGPAFHPEAVRLEGDDPLSVAVLLDVSGGVSAGALREMQAGLARWAPRTLNPRDHLAVYAFDCRLYRARQAFAPALSIEVQKDITDVLATPDLHSGPGARCGNSRALWDALAAVAGQLGTQPGRRVLLTLTDGLDSTSTNTWEQLREYASGLSVAIFALRELQAPAAARASTPQLSQPPLHEDPLALLCAGTGGVLMGLHPGWIEPSLTRAISLIRRRYVLYFRRPVNQSTGRHRMDVTVSDQTAVVRPTGLVLPLRDEKQMQDPSTVPADASRAPVMGTRRILQPASPPAPQ